MTDRDDAAKGRRKFLTGCGVLGVAATGLAGMGATARYMFPNVLYEPSQIVKVGRPSDYAEDSQTFLSDEKLFLHKTPEGIFAISAVCTHLGCIVASKEDGFSCPCHGSIFDEDGNVIGGPAPRGLPWFEVTLSPSDQLIVDRSRTVDPGTKLPV